MINNTLGIGGAQPRRYPRYVRFGVAALPPHQTEHTFFAEASGPRNPLLPHYW